MTDRAAAITSGWTRWAPALVLVATAVVYLPSLGNGFVNWDDPENTTENWAYRGLGAEQLRWMFSTFHMGHYQPLAWLTLGADFVVWKMNPFGYHLTSLVFHLASTLIFYLVAIRLLTRAAGARDATPSAALRVAAAFAAGVFALHPMRVESVAWATERRDVVSGLFFLLAVLLHVDALDASRGRGLRRAASLVAFALALLGKSITATLPAVLLVLDAYPLRRWSARAVVEKLPYFALSALAIAIGIRAQSSTETLAGLEQVGATDRAAIAAYGLLFYVRKAFAPVGLSPAHVIPAEFRATAAPFVASAIGVLAITALAVALRRRRPALLAIWTAYAVSLAPVLGLVQVWRQFVAVRYSYLACLGLALGAGGLLHAWIRARAAGGGAGGARALAAPALAAAALLATLGALTLREARAWRDSESLWAHAIDADPANYLAHANLAAHFARTGRADAAEAEFREALRVNPGYGDALAGLGALALAAGRSDEAGDLLERALASNTSHPAALSNIGVIQMQRGQNREAIETFRRAAALDPSFFDAWLNLGIASQSAGDDAAAAAALGAAVRLNPEHAGARANLAAALFRSGAWEDALATARESLTRDPRDLAAANLAAWILATSADPRLRDGADAVRLARAAIDATRGAPPAHLVDTYAAALAAAGRFDDAVAAARDAIERATAAGDSSQAAAARASLDRYARGEAIVDGPGAPNAIAPAPR